MMQKLSCQRRLASSPKFRHILDTSLRWYDKKGFSLVEVVMVLGILGVLSISAIVYAPSLDRTRLEVAARQALSDIEFAKQNASITGVTSGVQFVSGGNYTVYQGSTAMPLTDPASKTDLIVNVSTKYPNVSLSNNLTVEFNSLGAPTTGGGSSVTLTSGAETRTITITANTGKLVLQ
ncbi:MAG: GspH/FimT family pseudopilin [Deltaproteobacteria bacterium]|nr:GspH/FimT family pseudopilin [Deltaproteobacteria bacterium]